MVIMDNTGNGTGNIGNSQYPLQFHWRIHCYSFFVSMKWQCVMMFYRYSMTFNMCIPPILWVYLNFMKKN